MYVLENTKERLRFSKGGRNEKKNENFTKKSQTRYDNDHKHGVEIIWYPNGNKMSEIEYKFDQKDGRAQGWFQDGKPIYDNHYRRGIQRLE